MIKSPDKPCFLAKFFLSIRVCLLFLRRFYEKGEPYGQLVFGLYYLKRRRSNRLWVLKMEENLKTIFNILVVGSNEFEIRTRNNTISKFYYTAMQFVMNYKW